MVSWTERTWSADRSTSSAGTELGRDRPRRAARGARPVRRRRREGETRLGALDAASFVAAVADEVLADYLELVEDIEREIDRLDERALRRRPDSDDPRPRSSGSAAGSG